VTSASRSSGGSLVSAIVQCVDRLLPVFREAPLDSEELVEPALMTWLA
jgi:hypothetical protein